MRVHLTAHSSAFGMETGLPEPVFLTVRPACKLPGDYCYRTDGRSLLRLLRQGTELRSSVLEDFERDLHMAKAAKLMNVEMSDKVLTDIGYFVD